MKFEKGHQIGFIAQEVESIVPEIVKTEEKGFKSVDYGKVTPLLVEAIKEQQKQIDDQKSMIDKLQKENGKLKNDFELLKEKVEKLVMEKKSPMKQPAASDTGGARKNIEE
jgi:predicted RNase H-like nuclease (RuvC/YqgF family)